MLIKLGHLWIDIADQQQNSFALPGGKVAFYTGILPICANEAGVAAGGEKSGMPLVEVSRSATLLRILVSEQWCIVAYGSAMDGPSTDHDHAELFACRKKDFGRRSRRVQ